MHSANNTITKSEIIHILSSNSNELFETANKIKTENKGSFIHLRALLEFTNVCKCNCLYCGLRAENNEVARYRLTEKEIIESAEKAKLLGFKTIVLQGGEDKFYSIDKLCEIIKRIKEFDIAVTLSIGEKSYEEYKALKEAGADRYLLRIETTDENLYKQLHPNMSHKNRFQCLENLKSLGFETGTGSLVGLPNQTIESLADDILFFKELNADMIGIGPFIPHQNTPLKNESKNNFDLSLRVMALTRLMLPDINIPATTAMETLKENGQIIALNSGANVVMLNVTETTYKEKYEIYPNKYGSRCEVETSINELKTKLNNLGIEISNSKGFRKD